MNIAIISDVHNNETNLKKVLNYCEQKKIKKIICCGDLASLKTLDFLCDNLIGEIFYTFGNMEEYHLNTEKLEYKSSGVFEYRGVKIFENYGETSLSNKQVAFVHYPEKAKKLCESGNYDVVFYGHTHKPWIENVETRRKQYLFTCTMLNPGNVANELYSPTFATWNTADGKFELVRVNELKN